MPLARIGPQWTRSSAFRHAFRHAFRYSRAGELADPAEMSEDQLNGGRQNQACSERCGVARPGPADDAIPTGEAQASDPEGPAMNEGRVKWFNAAKGYGFIEGEGGLDVFVHHTVIQREGYRTLKPGEAVAFEVTDGPKGLQATLVQPLP